MGKVPGLVRDLSAPFLHRKITTIMVGSIRELYAIDQSTEQATTHLQEQVPVL